MKPPHPSDPQRNFAVDLGLAVMCAVQVEGQTVRIKDIAAVTGLSNNGVFWLEQQALKKLRNRLKL